MPAVHSLISSTCMVEPLERRTLFATIQVPGLVEAPVAVNQLVRPTAMDFAPDGRLFVTQQGGAVRVIKNGTLLNNPFLTITPIDSSSERGLLGIAFDPNFTSNGYLYVYHTVPNPLHNRVTRFTADPNNPDVVAAGSGVPILDLETLGAGNHNGGAIHFGADGKLYVAVGENAVPSNAQTLGNRLGKMLRINPDGTIPTDNPFYNTAAGANRAIWALGLRNPYTFAVQPGTGTIYINDVGQSDWEEIDGGVAGANYGWPGIEGERAGQALPTIGTYRDPLFAYGHIGNANSTGTAITGGTFYNPPVAQFAADWVGDYFYADLGNGWIRKYDTATDSSTLIATAGSTIVDLKTAPDGSLYFLERGATANSGTVRRFRADVTSPTTPFLNLLSDTGASNTDRVTADNTPRFDGNAPAGSTVRIVMDGTTVVGSAVTTDLGRYTVITSAVPDGVHQFTAVTTNAAGLTSDPSPGVTVTIDTVKPAVTGAAFDFRSGPHKLRYTFSENVGPSLEPGDVTVDNPLIDALPFPAHNVTYDPATNTAVFTFDNFPNGQLGNGNYRAFLNGDGVEDLAGNTLGATHLLEFYVLHGDIDRNRAVNSDDFIILARNFGRPGSYDEGDLDADGTVTSNDFVILASNFGRTMPALSPPPSIVSSAASSTTSAPKTYPLKRAARRARRVARFDRRS